MGPESRIGVGIKVMSTKSEIYENYDCSDVPKVKSKSYQSRMKQKNSTELLGNVFINLYGKEK